MKKFLQQIEFFYSHLSHTQRQLLLDAVVGFRAALLSIDADKTISGGVEALIKKNLTSLIPSILSALTSGPSTLVSHVTSEAKIICPTLTADLADRLND
jgi:hypothetical protein